MHNQEITPKSEKQTHVLVGVTDNIFFSGYTPAQQCCRGTYESIGHH